MTSFDISALSKLNDRYHMFRTMAREDEVKDAGFLFSVEDSLLSLEMDTCCGSEMLEGYRPPFEAEPISRMRSAGGLLIGKTNMDEFGFGSFSADSPFGIPKNPYDSGRSCGGAAGGAACAAAVIDDHVSLAVSSGGSLCGPAGFCGVYGMAPTYGRVSKHGVLDSASSIDRVGVLSSDATNMIKHIRTISGADSKDPASCMQPELGEDRKIGSVAVPEGILETASQEVKDAFNESVEHLRSMGIDVGTVKIQSLKYSASAYKVLMTSEASTALARYCGMRYGRQKGDLALGFDDYFTSFRTKYFGKEVKKGVILGTYARMEGSRERYYNKARMVRQLIIEEYRSVFKEYDAVVTPTVPCAAPMFSDIPEMSTEEKFAIETYTSPPSLAGMPHLSVPCGYNGEGMPIGLQFIADQWNDSSLFSVAKLWEDGFDMIKPEVSI